MNGSSAHPEFLDFWMSERQKHAGERRLNVHATHVVALEQLRSQGER